MNEYLSTCCGSSPHRDSDLCSSCFEHADFDYGEEDK